MDGLEENRARTPEIGPYTKKQELRAVISMELRRKAQEAEAETNPERRTHLIAEMQDLVARYNTATEEMELDDKITLDNFLESLGKPADAALHE